MSILIEHTAGKFPLWLTPDQFVVLPISDQYNDYANQVVNQLAWQDIRGIIDDRTESIGRKIRDNELKKIPFLLIVGEKEAAAGGVGVRRQGDGDKGMMKVAEFATYFKELLWFIYKRRGAENSKDTLPLCTSAFNYHRLTFIALVSVDRTFIRWDSTSPTASLTNSIRVFLSKP